MQEEVPFPEISKSIWSSILFSLSLLLSLYYLSQGGQQPVDPYWMFLISWILLVILALQTIKFEDLKKAFGFSTPYPGFGWLSAIIGIGIASILYTSVTRPFSIVYSGNSAAMQIIKPLYLPLSIEPYLFITLPSLGVLLFYLQVGLFEELYKIVVFKNISNWLVMKNLREEFAMTLGFFGSLLLWWTYHFFSWGGLEISGLIAIIVYGIIFWLPYFIPDIIGILTPEKPVEWRGVIIVGAITSHTTWDFLVTQGLFIDPGLMISISLLFIVGGIVGMYLIRHRFKSVFIEPVL